MPWWKDRLSAIKLLFLLWVVLLATMLLSHP